jgi:hypothetical protein
MEVLEPLDELPPQPAKPSSKAIVTPTDEK